MAIHVSLKRFAATTKSPFDGTDAHTKFRLDGRREKFWRRAEALSAKFLQNFTCNQICQSRQVDLLAEILLASVDIGSKVLSLYLKCSEPQRYRNQHREHWEKELLD